MFGRDKKMTLNQLEYFCAVCRCHSITKAADELYVSQPTISVALKKLEEEFLDNENRAYFKLGLLLEGSNIIIYNGKKFENPKKLFEYLIMPVNIIDVAKDFIKSQYVLAWLEIKGFQKEIVLFENLVISIEQKERKNDSIRKI